MIITSIRIGIPFFNRIQEKERAYSRPFRASAIGGGTMALLFGIMIFARAPAFEGLGTITGWVMVPGGGALILAGVCVRWVKEKERANRCERETKPTDTSIDFSQITPENIEQFFDRRTSPEGLVGDFDLSKGEVHMPCPLSFMINSRLGAAFGMQDNQFIVDENGTSDKLRHFSNFKEMLDYFFRGEYYQGDIKHLRFLRFKTSDGRSLIYHNPYLKTVDKKLVGYQNCEIWP